MTKDEIIALIEKRLDEDNYAGFVFFPVVEDKDAGLRAGYVFAKGVVRNDLEGLIEGAKVIITDLDQPKQKNVVRNGQCNCIVCQAKRLDDEIHEYFKKGLPLEDLIAKYEKEDPHHPFLETLKISVQELRKLHPDYDPTDLSSMAKVAHKNGTLDEFLDHWNAQHKK